MAPRMCAAARALAVGVWGLAAAGAAHAAECPMDGVCEHGTCEGKSCGAKLDELLGKIVEGLEDEGSNDPHAEPLYDNCFMAQQYLFSKCDGCKADSACPKKDVISMSEATEGRLIGGAGNTWAAGAACLGAAASAAALAAALAVARSRRAAGALLRDASEESADAAEGPLVETDA